MSPWVEIQAADGYRIPVWWQPGPASAKGSVLILPALGARAEFYADLAAAFVGRGYHAAVMELRGNGRSPLRPSRRVDWDYGTLVSDAAAAARWLRDRAPASGVVPVGHSLGGQLALLAAAGPAAAFDTAVLVACASPYYDNFAGRTFWQLYLGTRIFPLLFFLYGYYPGHRMGFGGREARGLMRDWLRLAHHDRFHLPGSEDIEADLADFSGRVLSVRFETDKLAPPRAVAAVNRKLRSARLDEVLLSSEDLGCRAGHFDWARHPSAVVGTVDRWVAGG